MLSQVTVGVLLTIYTFQVLLLNQNVDAFLWEKQHNQWDTGRKALSVFATNFEQFWPLSFMPSRGQEQAKGTNHGNLHSHL